jgi:uncharacterized protein (DUF779 family)
LLEAMARFAIHRVKATPQALELIERVVERNGPVAFYLSDGSSDDDGLICLTRAELLPSDTDVKLGEIGGGPLYVEAEQYERWGRPAVVVDVAPGPAGSCSLEGLEELHFVGRLRSAAPAGS